MRYCNAGSSSAALVWSSPPSLLLDCPSLRTKLVANMQDFEGIQQSHCLMTLIVAVVRAGWFPQFKAWLFFWQRPAWGGPQKYHVRFQPRMQDPTVVGSVSCPFCCADNMDKLWAQCQPSLCHISSNTHSYIHDMDWLMHIQYRCDTVVLSSTGN